MLVQSEGAIPTIDPTAQVSPYAILSGAVHVGPRCRIGPGAILVAEGAPIRLGADCVVMETAVLRGVPGHAVSVEDRVLIGPRAYLVGCTIEADVFLATGATVFNGARIGRGSEVRINGLVHLCTVLQPDSTVPIGWVAVGEPAQILPPSDHESIWAIQRELDFPRVVFNQARPANGDSMMPTLMPKYSASLRRRHAADKTVA